MWTWISNNANGIQAVAALVIVVLTVVGILVTAWYVMVTRAIAQTTHAQLATILQPFVRLEARRETIYESQESGREIFRLDVAISIRNTGKSALKIHGVKTFFVNTRTRRLHPMIEILDYGSQVLMPEEIVASTHTVECESREWHQKDHILAGLQLVCGDLSDLSRHMFLLNPIGGLRHSATLNRPGGIGEIILSVLRKMLRWGEWQNE
jgi:hypothetical protein